MQSLDVLVIGGGINGTGIARDLAGRGIDVMLCEKGDLGGASSSVSTKLIHGGLSYLETMNLALVKEALDERKILLHAAPHIVRPIDFVVPHHEHMWPMWLTKCGLFVYDLIARNKNLIASKFIDLTDDKRGDILQEKYETGFTYTDCWVDDARLVVANAIDAHEKGASIVSNAECIYVEHSPENAGWVATIKDNITGKKGKVFAKVVVNASGPWINNVLDIVDNGIVNHDIRWVKGSHIIVNSLYQGDHGYVLQNHDKRRIFVMPYEGKYTLIGATDVDYTGDINDIRIDMHEVQYLCDAVNRFFNKEITPKDVEWTYSGVLPLLDDKGEEVSKIAKSYVIETNEHHGSTIVSIYGGKISTYRKLSEEVGNIVNASLGNKGTGPWTAEAELPGAEGYSSVFKTFYKAFARDYEWLPRSLIARYAISYGVRARSMLQGLRSISEMGTHLGDNVYEAEIRYLVEKEWAFTVEDILFRRTKLGLHVSKETVENIEDFLQHI